MANKPTVVRGFAPPEDVEELYRDRLAKSGLDVLDGKALKMKWLTSAETKDLGFWNVPSLKIPYFDPLNGKPMTARPNWPEFYRVRWLVEPPPRRDGKKPAKYLQPLDTGICAYFPTLGSFDWKEIFDDYAYKIVITEGELKAAKGCKEGFATIGLGGVDSFRSLKEGLELLPILEKITWARREVVICYDSDVKDNPNVALAMKRLADALCDRGAVPKMLILPQPTTDKVGLDDFLVDNDGKKLSDLIKVSQHLTLSRTLWDINDNHSFVKKPLVIVRHDDAYLMKPAEFTLSLGTKTSENELKADGDVSVKMVPAGPTWLSWPLRNEVHGMTYAPEHPPLAIFEKNNKRYFNVWKGFAVAPVKGDVSPFLEVVDMMFENTSIDDKLWFLRWCGYPIRHPGAKLHTSVILHSRDQGTGKSTIGYTLKTIYGDSSTTENFSKVSYSELTSAFNSFTIRKQFVMGDDLTGFDKKEVLDQLKTIITQQEVNVNEKNQPNYSLPDKANWLWTSNHANAFPVEDKDRRFFVHEVASDQRPISFWEKYYDWLDNRGGSSAIFHYFLYELDMGDFNPHAHARETAAKRAMIEASTSTLGQFIRDAVSFGPEKIFTMADGSIPSNVVGVDLFTSRDILAFYRIAADDDAKANSKLVTNQLREKGVPQIHSGNPVSVPGKKLDRYWALRNQDKWLKASLEEIQRHLSGENDDKPKPQPGKKKYTR